MLGRFLLAGIFCLVSTAGPALANEGVSAPAERQRLTCTGMMMTPDMKPPGTKLVADGMVDLGAMRVRGFGMGSVPIVLLTDSRIVFSASGGGPGIDGTIDRRTGATRIVVHPAKKPQDELIGMTLTCRFVPAIS